MQKMRSGEGGSHDTPSGGGGAAVNVPESEYVALVMKRFPFFLQLRERYCAVSREPSYASLPHFATTEAEHALRREDVVNLLHQWLSHRGFSRTVEQLQQDTGIEAWDLGLGSDLLPALLQAAAPDARHVFAERDDSLAVALSEEAEDAEVVVNDELPGGVWAEVDVGAASAAEEAWRDSEAIAGDVRITLGQICRMLVAGNNPELRMVVASTWTLWSSSADILRQLFQFYWVPETALGSPEETAAHPSKVVRAIVWFVVTGNGPKELTNGLVGRFAGRLFDSGRSKHAAELRQALARFASMEDAAVSKPKSWEDPQVPKNIFSPSLSLSNVPVVEVARQMTLLDAALYAKMTAAELLSRGWLSGDDRGRRRAPHVVLMMHRFRVLESWAAGSIVEEQNDEAASQVLGYFVELAKCLIDMNSFHSAAALWGGMSCDAVWRLRSAFTGLSAEQKQYVAHLEVSLSSWRGYAAYKRLYLDALASGSPVVPFLLPHLQGLVLVSVSSPSAFGSLVNWPKFAALQKLLADMRLGVGNRFPFLVVVQIQNFLQTEKLSFYLRNNTVE